MCACSVVFQPLGVSEGCLELQAGGLRKFGGARLGGEPGRFGLSACIRQQTCGAAGELRFPVEI